MKKHVVIIGLGGVGGYFGFKINQQNEKEKKFKVSFVARGETFKNVKENGLKLWSTEHSESATRPDEIHESVESIKQPDLVLICVKAYDLENVCKQLKKVITEDTIILPMMNGADIHERIRNVLPDQVILPSCIYVASHIKSKGVIEHKGKSGKMIFGKDSRFPSAKVEWVVELMRQSGIEFEFKTNALTDIWQKFIFIASVGLVSAKYNSSIGMACNDEVQREETTRIMAEIKKVADCKEIGLAEDIIEESLAKSSAFPYDTPTSLQLDVNSGKKSNELNLFAGAIINYGKFFNIGTPYTEKIYNELTSKLDFT